MRVLIFLLLLSTQLYAQSGSVMVTDTLYLGDIKAELVKSWPQNRILNVVFHGHSVPLGYFKGVEVRIFDSYP